MDLSAPCTGIGVMVFRQKVTTIETAQGSREARADLHNHAAEAALFALLCPVPGDKGG